MRHPWLGLALAACSSQPEGPVVVLGLQSALGVSRLEVSAESSGVPLPGGEWFEEDALLPFPREVPLGPLQPGASLAAHVETYAPEQPAVLVERLLDTTVPSEGKWLLRIRLEKECIAYYQLPGGQNAPECLAPETCVAAACVDPSVPTDALEPYREDWAEEYADACKPLDAGEPTLALGLGEDTFVPLVDGGDIPMQLGPQGGYHIWMGIRTQNLHQSGSQTSIAITAEDGSVEIGTQLWANALVPASEGACEIIGLQYYTPSKYWEPLAILEIVDLPVRVDAQVVDERGDVAFATVHGFLR